MVIAILLSTFNGEKYLQEQLDSLLTQTFKNWKLFIRDDGSGDRTIEIIKDYSSRYPDLITFIQDSAGNLKSAASFMYLLSVINSEYYMFCDQDDVWLPFKIEKTYKKIKELEAANPNKGVVVFTDLVVVGSDLKVIDKSMWNYNKINPENAKCFYKTACLSSITGCTLIFNNAIKEKVLPYPQIALMHDWWLSLNAVHYGVVDYIDVATILYRQHSGNVLGAEELNKNHYLKRFVLLWKTIPDNIKVLKMLDALKFEVKYSRFFFTKIKILINNLLHK